MVANPGVKENGDKRFNGAWTGALAMFKEYRSKGAPIAFAPDPLTSHQTGDKRYAAIAFFDACLALRLPASGNTLRKIDQSKGWLSPSHRQRSQASGRIRRRQGGVQLAA